ncbi:MAG TPA: hypothetical protein VD813_01785 [Pseudonocardia sp.]|nr:hypothetical protein [Pseudonocardia sp.]
METLTAAPAAAPTPPRRPRVTLGLLRAAITVHLLAVLAQPVLAGRYLVGDLGAIAAHGVIGSLLALLTLVVGAAAAAYVVVGRGRLWVLPAVVALFLAVGFQIGAGFSRQLDLHVPLGVAIVLTSVLLAIWVWSPVARRPRHAAVRAGER